MASPLEEQADIKLRDDELGDSSTEEDEENERILRDHASGRRVGESMMDYLERQTREMLGRKVKPVPSHVINEFKKDQVVQSLKQRISNIKGDDDSKTPRKRNRSKSRGRSAKRESPEREINFKASDLKGALKQLQDAVGMKQTLITQFISRVDNFDGELKTLKTHSEAAEARGADQGPISDILIEMINENFSLGTKLRENAGNEVIQLTRQILDLTEKDREEREAMCKQEIRNALNRQEEKDDEEKEFLEKKIEDLEFRLAAQKEIGDRAATASELEERNSELAGTLERATKRVKSQQQEISRLKDELEKQKDALTEEIANRDEAAQKYKSRIT